MPVLASKKALARQLESGESMVDLDQSLRRLLFLLFHRQGLAMIPWRARELLELPMGEAGKR
jgi:hypothetical protein